MIFIVLVLLHVAFAADTGCTNKGGNCQIDTSTTCTGSYVSGFCDGAANRRCCLPAGSTADIACTNQGGHCQDATIACSGGYGTGLCDGAGNRKCCFPTSSGASCTTEEKDLACELFNSTNVFAYQEHPSGVQDNAYPYNNLRDMCNNLKASRSSYSCDGCSAPGGTTCLSPNLLKYLVYLKNHGHVTINELAGACHTCLSRHYSGLAVDLGMADHRDAEYLQKCTEMGGWGQNEGNHIHCQFYDGPHPNWQ